MNKKTLTRLGVLVFLCYAATIGHLATLRGMDQPPPQPPAEQQQHQPQQATATAKDQRGGNRANHKKKRGSRAHRIGLQQKALIDRFKNQLSMASSPSLQRQQQQQQNQTQPQRKRRENASAAAKIDRVYACKNTQGTSVMLPRVPDFVIGGTQKGGTTALLTLIKRHPLILGTKSFEAHFFDYDERAKALDQTHLEHLSPEMICDLRLAYAKDHFPFNKLIDKPHIRSFEKTPAYILSEKIPARIKAIAPWTKVIFSLRNPVDRAFSHYQMLRARNQIPADQTFEFVLGTDLEVLNNYEFAIPMVEHPFPKNIRVNPRRIQVLWKQKNMIYRGLYADQLRPWLEHFTVGQDLMVVQFERMSYEPQVVVNEILDFLGIRRYDYHPSHFNQSYSPVIGEHHTKDGVRMKDETREYLLKLYEPYNEELANMIGSSWRGIWNDSYY